jgi:hypothetical protein
MRWFHRFSQLAFGTVLGRLLTRFVLLPFLGAFVILEGLQEITHMVIGAIIPIHAELVSRESLLVLGLYILALVNFATARTAT